MAIKTKKCLCFYLNETLNNVQWQFNSSPFSCLALFVLSQKKKAPNVRGTRSVTTLQGPSAEWACSRHRVHKLCCFRRRGRVDHYGWVKRVSRSEQDKPVAHWVRFKDRCQSLFLNSKQNNFFLRLHSSSVNTIKKKKKVLSLSYTEHTHTHWECCQIALFWPSFPPHSCCQIWGRLSPSACHTQTNLAGTRGDRQTGLHAWGEYFS